MSTGTSGSTLAKLLLPISLLRRIAFEPVFTGPLLFILLRGPDDIRDRLLEPFRNNLLARVGLQTVIKTVKWLFGLGLASRVNQFLTNFTLNHGYVRRQGKAWNFDQGGKDEVILVTGGCSGFGLSMIKIFSARAPLAKLIVLDVQDQAAELKSIPNLTFYKCDLTSDSDIEDTCNAILETSPPTVLINNAGIANVHMVLEASQEWLRKIFAINFLCHYSLIQKFLPRMLENRKGHIVTLASMGSYFVTPGLVDYSATKAAALTLHEGLTMELTHRYKNGETINTTSVHPSWARTNMTAPWDKYMSKQLMLTADDVADAVVTQVLKGKSGQLYLFDVFRYATGIRGWPTWLGEALRANTERETRLGT